MSRLISVADQSTAFWFSWMVLMTWQVTGLVTVLAAISYLLQKRSARFR